MSAAAVLPHVTASLNAASLALLVVGFGLIRSGDRIHHRKVMLAAVAVSALFLAVYLVYHATAPVFVFPGPDTVKPWYYALLVSHVILAVAAVPVIAVTLRRAVTERFDAHRRLARWTFVLWAYVASSGIAVYWLLYHTYGKA